MTVRCLIVLTLFLMVLGNTQRGDATDDPELAGYFLPGDAFFHTRITEAVLKKLDENPDYAFECNRDSWSIYNSGYYRLSLGKQNRKLAKQIKECYYQVRLEKPLTLHVLGNSPNSVNDHPLPGKTKFMEINGVSLFFYNEDYDWKKRHVGLKYNENWYQELSQFGFPNGVYDAYVNTPEAIIESWRFSSVIPPLSVQLPSVPIKKKKAIKEPMIPKGRLKAIMLYDTNYQEYYDMKTYSSLIEITNEKTSYYFAGEGVWHQTQ